MALSRSSSSYLAVSTAVGSLALGVSAPATASQPTPPDPPESTWTVAEAVASSPRPLALTAIAPTAQWASVIGSIQPSSHASPQFSPQSSSQPGGAGGCCFSNDWDGETYAAQISSGLSRWMQSEPSVYLLLALILWFSATAPWVLQRFWLMQLRLAQGNYGNQRVKAPSQRRSRSRSGYRAVALGDYTTGRYTTGNYATGHYATGRFAKPRVAPVAQSWAENWPEQGEENGAVEDWTQELLKARLASLQQLQPAGLG